MSAAAIAVGALAGVAAGLAAEPLVRRLPAGIEDSVEEPAWTRALRRPPTMEILRAAAWAARAAPSPPQGDGRRRAGRRRRLAPRPGRAAGARAAADRTAGA